MLSFLTARAAWVGVSKDKAYNALDLLWELHSQYCLFSFPFCAMASAKLHPSSPPFASWDVAKALTRNYVP